VVLSEHISDLWTALTHYLPKRFADLHNFVVYRSHRKLFWRVKQDAKAWKVHVAEKILAWTPEPNELAQEHHQWFEVPHWLNSFTIPPERLQMMKTRKKGLMGKELVEVEFSSATVGFWAWLLGILLLNLRGCVESTNKKIKSGDQSFKGDLPHITQLCHSLYLFVNGGARIVETLLTQTSLATVFNLPLTIQRMFPSLSGFSFLISSLCAP
jgi:hypothetical protein